MMQQWYSKCCMVGNVCVVYFLNFYKNLHKLNLVNFVTYTCDLIMGELPIQIVDLTMIKTLLEE